MKLRQRLPAFTLAPNETVTPEKISDWAEGLLKGTGKFVSKIELIPTPAGWRVYLVLTT